MGDCNKRATLVIVNYFFHTQHLYTCKLALVTNADHLNMGNCIAQGKPQPKSTTTLILNPGKLTLSTLTLGRRSVKTYSTKFLRVPK